MGQLQAPRRGGTEGGKLLDELTTSYNSWCPVNSIQIVHASVGAGHYNNITIRSFTASVDDSTEMADDKMWSCVCSGEKGCHSHILLQQDLVGAPVVCIGGGHPGPLSVTDSRKCNILIAIDYFTKWPETYEVPDQSTNMTAERLVDEMRRAPK